MAGRSRFAEKPEKNSYSHPAEAMCYTATRLFGSVLASRDSAVDDMEIEARSRLHNDRTRNMVTGY
jgi:hypothetical protein